MGFNSSFKGLNSVIFWGNKYHIILQRMLQNVMVGPAWWKKHPTLLPESPLSKQKGSCKLAYNMNIYHEFIAQNIAQCCEYTFGARCRWKTLTCPWLRGIKLLVPWTHSSVPPAPHRPVPSLPSHVLLITSPDLVMHTHQRARSPTLLCNI